MHHIIIWYTIIKATAWYCSKHLYVYVLKFAKQGPECLWMLPVRARVFVDAACEDQCLWMLPGSSSAWRRSTGHERPHV